MGAAIGGADGAMMSKLLDLLAEAKWQGEISPGEYRWFLDYLCGQTVPSQSRGRSRESARTEAIVSGQGLSLQRPPAEIA